jgi:WD40 repeat protein/DNA-binding SARP family transcriptional activator
MPRLQLSLLGTFRAALDGEPATAFGYDKVRALLAYLAVEADHPHRREMLAGLLWPDQPENAARQSLSQALFRLRRAIGDEDDSTSFLIVTSQSIQFDPSSDYWLDATAFNQLLKGCKAHDHRRPEVCDLCREALEEAVGLYCGGFLSGLSIPDSAAFEEWTLLRRERLHQQVQDGLHRLATCYETQGDCERALAFAVRQVELDPWQERAHRQVMLLYARMGRRATALRQYEACRQLLAEELGAEPSQQTQELYASLLQGELPARLGAMEAVSERESRAVGACPYRGLAAFREVDAPYFFGREGFTQRVLEAVHTPPPVTVILGSSGSGKSSVAFAGLLPRLREQFDWLIIDFRPGTRPFYTLAGVLLPLLEPDLSETDRLIETRKLANALGDGEVRLHNVVARALEINPAAERVLLLVDQFEELYTLCPDPDERDRFLDMLLVAAEAAWEGQRPPLVLLLTLRADFMGQALAHRPFADALQEGALMLGPMTREELREAIEKPAERQGAAFEAGLVGRLLDDVGQAPGSLPLLEFALTLLWARLDRGWMTHAAYEDIGRVEGALAGYAEGVYAELRTREREAARRVFVQLVQPGEGTEDTRRVATRVELGDVAGNWILVQLLADKRLVVTGRDSSTGLETVEVVHEALIQRWGRLQWWIEEDRAFRTWQERLRVALRGWEASDRDGGALLRGVPLTEAEGWLAQRGAELSRAEVSFIEASVALRERRRRRAVLGLASGLVMALILTLLAVAQWWRAEGEVDARAAAETEALRQASVGLAAQALAELEGTVPERSVLLALEALDGYPYTPQAESALARAVHESKPYVVIEEPGGGEYPTRVAWSPDGRYLAVGRSFNEVVATIWELDNVTQVNSVVDEGTCVTGDLAWSPTGDRLLTSRWQPALPKCDAIKVWDLKTGSEVLALDGHEGPPGSVDWSPDGATLVSVGDDGTARIWDAETGVERLILPVDPGAERENVYVVAVRDAVWSPAGDRVATAAQQKTATVWDPMTGAELLTLSGHSAGLMGAAWSPDGRRLATASEDGTVRVWDAATAEGLLTLIGHTDEVRCVAWSPDGGRLASAGKDGAVRVWDATTGAEMFVFRGVTNPYHVAWSPSDERLAVRGEMDVRVLDLSQRLLQLAGHTDNVQDARWSPDGARVATSGQDGAVRIWDATSGEELLVLDAHPGGAGYLSWSPDGTRIVTTGRNDPATIWDSVTGERLLSVPAFAGAFFYDVSWSPDGSRIVASSFPDHRTLVFDATTGETITAVQDEACGFLMHPSWSPDGDRFITGCHVSEGDTPARVWDAATGTELLMLESQDGRSVQGEWSPDGDRIAVGYGNGTARVRDAATGEVLTSFAGNTGNIIDLNWSPDGTRIASGDETGWVKVWDAVTGEEVLAFFMSGHVDRVEWSPDGQQLITAGGFQVPGVRRAWQSTEELIEYARECCVFRELTAAERAQYGLPAR